MNGYELVAAAAKPTVAVVCAVTDDQFGAATPCAEFDVRTLIGHLLFWGPALEGAARKEFVPQTDPGTDPVYPAAEDLRSRLADQIDGIVSAWSEPDAWEGTTRMGSPMELPASMIGGMVLGELVVHGWDLARATDQHPTWDDDVLNFVHRELEWTAEQGREMGVYGPRVAVPDDGSMLDRILGLTGRDPHWVA
jgi:uncharacterized protein (TIGR03086 family)